MFCTDPAIRQWYQNWIAHVLNRVNAYTGKAYKGMADNYYALLENGDAGEIAPQHRSHIKAVLARLLAQK